MTSVNVIFDGNIGVDSIKTLFRSKQLEKEEANSQVCRWTACPTFTVFEPINCLGFAQILHGEGE